MGREKLPSGIHGSKKPISMSVPDHELGEDDLCDTHGRMLPCWECRRDIEDQYAEWEYQDSIDGR